MSLNFPISFRTRIEITGAHFVSNLEYSIQLSKEKISLVSGNVNKQCSERCLGSELSYLVNRLLAVTEGSSYKSHLLDKFKMKFRGITSLYKLAEDNLLGCLNIVDESLSMMTDLDNRAVVFSFITTREDSDCLPYNTQKQLLAKAFQSNKSFECGELLDTLERRALYPMIHCSIKPLDEVEDIELLKMNDLGDAFILRQGIYIESKRHQSTKDVTDEKYHEDIAYIFMGFKSVDLTVSEALEKSWKDWTGARLVNSCLRKEFHISRYSFFHRIGPSDPELFMYILIIECHNVTSSNKTYLLDFVQKLRVERVFGYLTVYKKEILSSTSAIIKGILSDPDEYVSKVDM